jgi:hypothetical protein
MLVGSGLTMIYSGREHMSERSNTFVELVSLSIGLALVLFCPYAKGAALLPDDVVMNGDAGRGSLLIIKLQVEGGAELPFVVDTGAPVTLLDQSLEPKLGKRLGTGVFHHFGTKHPSHIYAAPKLYLNGTRLRTGARVWTGDFKELPSLPGQPTMGILGMDCLSHYCLQLDFAVGKLRFLNPNRLDGTQLGQRYPIHFSFPVRSPFIHQRGFGAQKEQRLLVDTGYAADGALTADVFDPASAKQGSQQVGGVGKNSEYTSLSECVWNAGTYTNLLIGHDGNLVGLRFLARHLVTLDFPNRSLYLNQTATGPLDGDRFIRIETAAKAAADSAQDFLQGLKKAGRLPGWTNDEKGTSHAGFRFRYFEIYPITANFDVQKNQDTSVYHYVLIQDAKDAPWVLQKAWLTDKNGHLVEEFPVH